MVGLSKESHNDRRCLHLHLTEKGTIFKWPITTSTQRISDIWSVLDADEKQLNTLMRKLLTKLDTIKD